MCCYIFYDKFFPFRLLIYFQQQVISLHIVDVLADMCMTGKYMHDPRVCISSRNCFRLEQLSSSRYVQVFRTDFSNLCDCLEWRERCETVSVQSSCRFPDMFKCFEQIFHQLQFNLCDCLEWCFFFPVSIFVSWL